MLLTCVSQAFCSWHERTFQVMGTEARVEIWEENPKKAARLIKQVIEEMERINQLMSPYISSSELSKLNKSAAKRPIKISKELFSLLKTSQEFSGLSHGAFDITFASVGYQYDYREGKSPSKDFIDKNKSLINYELIKLNKKKSTVTFLKPGVKIDLGGIAKGHAVDQAINMLLQEGVEHAFVQAGGDSRLIGDKKGRLWNIGIRHPRKEGEVITQVPLENVAISTSGDYERFYIKNGERVHHIIDPRTGKSSSKSISVTIIADSSTKADALSTTVFVLGFEKGLALIESIPGVSAIVIDNQGKFHYTKDLNSY
ncbi:MAG: FAD:protein FMN transferase [Gammaproteobacteria bacterium]|nr:FAD:protein FMN transferase [Gammaproteobacteria bacterium]